MVSCSSKPPEAEAEKNTERKKNVYHIGGLQVEFPYQPYGTQFAFMAKVISTLDRALREGHCNALVESPTGTGKSLSLLCSTLAWQQNFKLKNQFSNLSHSKPDPQAVSDPLGHGGGFIPEEVSTSIPESQKSEPVESTAKRKKEKAAPTIYYASRTHSQISQVIRELRKTSYRVPMAVLASRKHYCTNKVICGKANIDEECKLLLRNQELSCSEFKNVHKVKGHPSLQRGGYNEVHDIEDLVQVGHVVKGCSYYAARSMALDAQLVFCPYNYIINPVIRGAMEVDIKGAIIILDEAHNIEDIACDAGSVDVDEDVLLELQMELEQLCSFDVSVYHPLYEMIQDLISWIERRKTTLKKYEFQHYVSCWTGDKALRELQEANITSHCFPILLQCATKAIKEASDMESGGGAHLSGKSVITLEGLFSSLVYFFSRNGSHMSDFQLALQRCFKREAGIAFGNWTHTLSLWCLNPAVVFRDIADLSLSVILTSGTLSPMNSFSSELGVQFGTCLEAPHVIDVESQVWPAIISTGPGNYPLNASYKTADGFAFQDALGKSLEEIFKVVPGGCIVFFPSYKLMEKLCNRWSETGQWSRLNAKKPIFSEPRGGSQDDLELVLKGYYDSICHGKKPATGRKQRAKKMNNKSTAIDSQEKSKRGGAALLAVCRGKVSEGIDFADDNARVVIIVGIPFPNIYDIHIALKKKYNDTYKSSKNLLNGNEWYCQQAFRALNQAAGRCIRHKLDYGAVILMDVRFCEERNRTYISKWLRRSLKVYDSLDMSIESLKSFFNDAKERFGKNSVNGGENICCLDQMKVSIKEEIHTLNEFGDCKQKKNSSQKYDISFSTAKPEDVKIESCVPKDEETNNENHIDLAYSFQNRSILSMASEHEEVSLSKETPCVVDVDASTSPGPGYFSKDNNSSSNITEIYDEYPDQLPSYSISFTNESKGSLKALSSVTVTPEKNVSSNTSLFPEKEASFNLSVNSHTHKRRKFMDTPFINLVEEHDVAMVSRTPTNPSTNSIDPINASCRINFSLNSSSAEHDHSNLPSSCVISSAFTIPAMDKRLQLYCSCCQNPLGLSDNQLYITCSLTSLSKVYLRSLLKERTRSHLIADIPVVITDASFVDQRLCNKGQEETPGQGIWYEEDGCVYNTIFCPFCSANSCLGVQIMATDASNMQLLNKILLYLDNLELKDPKESRDKSSKNVNLPPVKGSGINENFLNIIEKYSYAPQVHNDGGWRTTKSKLTLSKRG